MYILYGIQYQHVGRDVWAVCPLDISLMEWNVYFMLGDYRSYCYRILFLCDKLGGSVCVKIHVLYYALMCLAGIILYRYLVSSWIVWPSYLPRHSGHIRQVAFGEREM